MPSVADALNAKPQLGAELAAAVLDLSANQEIAFGLYRRFVFPLDGMNYWVRVPSSDVPLQVPGIQLLKGMNTFIKISGEATQVTPGGFGAIDIVAGTITNPLAAVDQGIETAESLFVDFTGPASSCETDTTSELEPGESIDIPKGSIAFCNALTAPHAFTVVLHRLVPVVSLPTDVTVQGSLHYDSAVDQREDATVDSNTVVFTALTEVQPFNQIGPDYLYIASYNGLRFAFSSRGYLYQQADLYHYVGKALYSVQATQIIDDPDSFAPDVVISNSLPVWLNLNNYVPPYPGFTLPFKLYPSFLVDDNLAPPFGAVHIEDSEALAQCPLLGPRMQADQLCRDRVKIHIYGANNQMASDFREFIEQYSSDWGTIGIAKSGAINDLKHPQPELKIIAQRKSIDFEVNYFQSVSRNIARQMIESVKCQFMPNIPGLGDEYAANYVSAPIPGVVPHSGSSPEARRSDGLYYVAA